MNKKKTVIRWNIHVVNINVGIDKKNLKERTIRFIFKNIFSLFIWFLIAFEITPSTLGKLKDVPNNNKILKIISSIC